MTFIKKNLPTHKEKHDKDPYIHQEKDIWKLKYEQRALTFF